MIGVAVEFSRQNCIHESDNFTLQVVTFYFAISYLRNQLKYLNKGNLAKKLQGPLMVRIVGPTNTVSSTGNLIRDSKIADLALVATPALADVIPVIILPEPGF